MLSELGVEATQNDVFLLFCYMDNEHIYGIKLLAYNARLIIDGLRKMARRRRRMMMTMTSETRMM